MRIALVDTVHYALRITNCISHIRRAAGRITRRVLPLIFAMGCLSCSQQEPRADLVIANGAEPGSLDPATSKGLEELRIVMALWEGLMRVDPKTALPIPGLAERHEVSPDGKVYTFYLRANATWSTGQRITAHDFVYSWRRVLDPVTASEYAGQLFYLKNAEAYFNRTLKDPNELGVRALDDSTLRVELTNPTPFFLGLCAFQTLSVVPRDVVEKHGDDWMRVRPLPVSGPYQLERWSLNDRVRLRANPHYWDATNTHCQVVDLLPIRSASTAFNLYERGGLDIIWDKELIPSELFPILRPRSDFHSFNYLGTYFLRFNTTRKPLDDPRVRRALTMCIDKQRLVDKILKTGEVIGSHFVPPGTANCRSPEGLAFDPEGARQLLKEAGYPNGQGMRPIEYLFESVSGGGSVHSKIGVELQQMWQRELGIKVELRQMEKQVYLAAQRSLDYDVSRSTWIGDYNDPNTFLDLFRSNNGNNRTGWKNQPYDDLMDQASVLTDLDQRANLLRQAESILVRDEAPIAPLYFYSGFNYHNPDRISGIHGNVLDSHPINAIRVRKEPAR
ncbi:MAG: peptide ABC transporter substrate-binding protein [Verrucomicrobia bacterium]|nr:peptide ABC transporter substrate-binding protein [Verrucomicrobiota bacterium]